MASATAGSAQSLDTTGRSNGLQVRGYSLFLQEPIFAGTGAGLSYGIGGLLDVGFDAGLLLREIEDKPAEESRLNFLLRGFAVRQSQGFPVSLSLSFTYHFGLVQESDFLDDQFDEYELIRTGRGYSVGTSMWRDFWRRPRFALRAGIGAGLEVERSTTDVASDVEEDDTDDTADPDAEPDAEPTEQELIDQALAEYPIERIGREIVYEASLGPVFRSADGAYTFSLLGTFRYTQDGELGGSAELAATFSRPRP